MPSSSRGLGDTQGPSVACLYRPYTRSLSALVMRFTMDSTATAASANAASSETFSVSARVFVPANSSSPSPNAPDPRSSDCARDTASFWRSFLDSRGDVLGAGEDVPGTNAGVLPPTALDAPGVAGEAGGEADDDSTGRVSRDGVSTSSSSRRRAGGSSVWW